MISEPYQPSFWRFNDNKTFWIGFLWGIFAGAVAANALWWTKF